MKSMFRYGLVLFFAAGALGAEITWERSDFDAILAQAENDGKPIAIDFYAVWCGPCKEMDKTTFEHEDVVARASKFVMAKFDAEKGEGLELARRFHVGSYPTLLFLGPDGGELNRYTGYLEPEDYLELMQLTLEGRSQLELMEAELKERPDDLELLSEIADGYVIRLQEDKALSYLKRLQEADPDNAEGALELAGLTRADLYRRMKDYAKASAALEALLNTGVELEHRNSVLRSLGIYLARAEQPEKSLEYFQQLIAADPSAGSYNALAWEYSQRGINLDEAEKAGLKAVELAGEDAGIMDTLAEVYFAQGRYEEAIELAKKEIELEPDDPYFAEQLEKYEKAKAEQASPEVAAR